MVNLPTSPVPGPVPTPSARIRGRGRRTRRAGAWLILLLLSLVLSCGRRDVTLILLHTNDIHSWFAPREGRIGDQEVALGGAPVLAGLIRQYRLENPGNTLYLDAGDLFTGTPISSMTEGLACVEVMNLLAPDAFAIGNHEFDHGMEAQRKALDRATFPVLQANVRMAGHAGPYAQADMLVNRGGLQIAILGLNSDALEELVDPAKLKHSVKVDSSQAVARKWLERVARTDLKICLSHRGFASDSLLALAVPGFDLIVGGHSHTELRAPVRVGATWIVQAGDQGRFLGVDTLVVREGQGITSLRGGLLPVVEGAAEPAQDVAALVAAQESRVNTQLGAQVATLTADWRRESRGESNIGNWICAALRREAGAQVGFCNSGGIRKDLAAGPVTLRDLWEISPFGNQVLVVPLSGARIRQIFQDELRQGGLHLQFDGLRVGAGEAGAPGAVLVDGKPMTEEGRYRVAMSDYVWGQLRQPADSLLTPASTGRLDRDMLIDRARAEREITPVLDGRWGPGRARGKP